jgi:hypothetical protein
LPDAARLLISHSDPLSKDGPFKEKTAAISGNGFRTEESCTTPIFEVVLSGGTGHFDGANSCPHSGHFTIGVASVLLLVVAQPTSKRAITSIPNMTLNRFITEAPSSFS